LLNLREAAKMTREINKDREEECGANQEILIKDKRQWMEVILQRRTVSLDKDSSPGGLGGWLVIHNQQLEADLMKK